MLSSPDPRALHISAITSLWFRRSHVRVLQRYTSIGTLTLAIDGLALGQHEIEAGIARGGRHSRYLLGRESNADGKHVFLRPQACNREVVVPRAVADSVTSAIEC